MKNGVVALSAVDLVSNNVEEKLQHHQHSVEKTAPEYGTKHAHVK